MKEMMSVATRTYWLPISRTSRGGRTGGLTGEGAGVYTDLAAASPQTEPAPPKRRAF